jgi:hypothetical protein
MKGSAWSEDVRGPCAEDVIFGTKREEVTDWRKLHTEELPDFYFSPNIIRVIKAIKNILNGSRRNRMAQCGLDLSGSG